MATLGAKPLHPPPPEPTPEPTPTAEQAADQAAEQAAAQQWEVELDANIEHLKSLDPASEHFAPDMLDALDILDNHVGGSVDRITELRDRVSRGIAAKARADLQEHLRWVEETIPPGVDRAMAALHGFAQHIDNLDPVADAELIAFGRQALGPTQEDET